MTLKELTSMKLHEVGTLHVAGVVSLQYIRVDGGWIYMTTDSMVFVPESQKDETVLLG